MRSPSYLGLRGRVALLIGMSIAPAICILLYTGLQERRLAGVEALSEAQRLAHLTASSQEGLLLAAPKILGILAHVPQVRDGDPKTCTKFLVAARSEYPLFLNIGRVESNGDVTSSALPTKGRVNLADRSWFQRAMKTRRLSVGEFQIGRITHQASINFGYPLMDTEGRIRWVLFAALDLAGIERVAAKVELPEGATVTVTDREGTVLVRYPHEERWVGQPAPQLWSEWPGAGHAPEGTFRAQGPDGTPRLYAFASVSGPATGAQLTIGIPEATAFAQVDRLLIRNLVVLCVIGLLALGLAFFGVDWLILRSLRMLIATAEQLATGDLSVRTGLTGAHWELGQLACAFDQMAEALQQRATEQLATTKRNTLLLEMYEKASHLSDQELYIYALDQAVALTDSSVGFFHQVSDDQRSIILTTWNLEALKTCTATPTAHYPIEAAGNWADCVRLKAPVIYNDYLTSPHRKGLPKGHAPVKRFMSIPVMDEDKVRYIFGVGNKVAEYEDSDVVQLQLVASELHKILKERKAAEALRDSEERFRTVFETANDAILLMDGEIFMDCNPLAVEMYGCPDKADLISHTPLDFSPETQPDGQPSITAAFAHINAAMEGMPQRFYWKHLRRDGTPFDAEVALNALVIKNKTYIQAIVRDVTDRKQAEEALLRAHDELELRVQQRTAELSRSNAELQQFAYVASHDLQEPLRKIMAFGDRLNIHAGPGLDERNRDYLQRMLNAADRMSGLINALLAYSRVTTKAQPFSSVNLSEVAREVLSDLEVAVEEAGAVIEIGDLPTIDADPSQMRQLLQNLIGNAIKFRREGVPPRVQLEAETIPATPAEQAPQVSNVMRLRVTDNGIGFDERFAERIFEVFERLHGRDQYAGSGMGLAICRKIVERHHGTIVAASTPGEGSTFTVTLPVNQPPEETSNE